MARSTAMRTDVVSQRLGLRPNVVLLLLAFGSLMVYAALVLSFPLERYISVPRATVGSLTERRPQAAFLLAGAGTLLHVAYIAAVLKCWRSDAREHLLPLIWGFGIAAAGVLVLLWPATSTDIFDYIFRGRMAAHYGANPYIDLPNRFAKDPLFKYLGWPNAPSAYGPLWELMSARMAAIGGTSVWRNVLLHKVLALIIYVLCGVVIMYATRPLGPKAQALGTILWLWNPLTLWEI